KMQTLVELQPTASSQVASRKTRASCSFFLWTSGCWLMPALRASRVTRARGGEAQSCLGNFWGNPQPRGRPVYKSKNRL
ncbi:MAG: hypothetical protein WCJ18_06120, partial [Planctomycetota bacterium]